MSEAPVKATERYARATSSSDLSPNLDRTGDADVLIAVASSTLDAAMPGGIDQRLNLAAKVWRMRSTGENRDLWDISFAMEARLQHFIARRRLRPMPSHARRQLVVMVLRWFVDPTCHFCDGVGKMAVNDDTGRGKVLVPCDACHGVGRRPIQREVPNAYSQHAEHLAEQLVANHSVLAQRVLAKLGRGTR